MRTRLDRLGLTYRAAAVKLGLSVPGLHHQMRGDCRVSRQTEMTLGFLERQALVRPYPAYPATREFESRSITQASPSTETVTTVRNGDLKAVDLRSAIRDLEQFLHRHKSLDVKLDQAMRLGRLRLIARLDGAETHQLDEIRRQRKPKLNVVED